MKDDSGLTYSLEAMLGILLIAGVLVFVTGNPPPTFGPSGKYSKIQLVNLGEDILCLIAHSLNDTNINEILDEVRYQIPKNMDYCIYLLNVNVSTGKLDFPYSSSTCIPSRDAVVVSRLVAINGTGVGELRIVLWYR